MLRNFLLVGAGGFLGSILRYGAGFIVKNVQFPFATFIVNILGCFIIGLVYGLAVRDPNFPMESKLFLATGICGGFTTFSTFAFENMNLMNSGHYLNVLFYCLGSVILGTAAVFAGLLLMKLFYTRQNFVE